MRYEIVVLRRKSSDDKPYEQSFLYESEGSADTVAAFLISVNKDLKDPISWECSCLQKKCGACAMVINGRPCLACDCKLSDIQINGKIRIEPLRKFPVIRDLICDRSVLWENLKSIRAWAEDDVKLKEDKDAILFDSGKCLQCGCCLEICPNFCSGGKFMGMSAMVPVSGLLQKLTPEQSRALRREYSSHIYAGCGKSLSCQNICPIGLDIEKLMVNSNAIVLWKHLFM